MVAKDFRVLVALLLVALLGLPGIAGARPVGETTDGTSPRASTLQDLIRQSVERIPHAQRILEGLEKAEATKVDRFLISWPIWDASGDGLKDVLVASFAIDPVTNEGHLTVRLLEGDTGREFSRHRSEFGADEFCIPWTARVGKKARKGMHILCLKGILGFSSTTEISWQITALSSRGRKVWVRRFTADGVSVGGQSVVRNAPVTMAAFDGIRGRATDLVVGLFDGAILFYESVNTTHVAVVDGRNGEVVDHPRRYVGINSISYPTAVSDYSGDGLDDYGVVSQEPRVEQEPGEGAPLDVAGFVRMQRGTDGQDVWRSSPFFPSSPQDAMLWTAHDVRGNSKRELIVSVTREEGDGDWQPLDYFLLDGKAGQIADRAKGVGFVWSTGDLDRDGDRDLLAERHLDGEGWLGVRWTGFTSSGRTIYKRKVVERGPHNDQGVWSGWFYIGEDGPEWDVEPDAVGDNVAPFWFRGDLVEDELLDQTVYRLVSMRRARTIARGDENLRPLRGSVDRRGGDFVQGAFELPDFSLDVRRGDSRRRLWKATLSPAEPLTEKSSYTYSSAERFDGDRCADVLTETNGKSGAWLTMLDGGSGEPLWTKTFWAPSDLEVSVGADRNPVC